MKLIEGQYHDKDGENKSSSTSIDLRYISRAVHIILLVLFVQKMHTYTNRNEVNEQNVPYLVMNPPVHYNAKRKSSSQASHSMVSGGKRKSRKMTIPADARTVTLPALPAFTAQFRPSPPPPTQAVLTHPDVISKIINNK
jgi:hypothetical protein